MKAGLFVIAALTAAASAEVHHRHGHKRRDEVVNVNAPAAVVYVDVNGKPLSTVYNGAAPAAATLNSYQPPAAAPKAKLAAVPKAAVPKPKSSAKPVASGSGRGIAYAPYSDSGGCKTQAEVMADFAMFDGYSLVRIYGTDCNQITTCKAAAKAHGKKLFLGIFDIAQVSAEAAIIIAGFSDGDWSIVDTVSVGNELVNKGAASVSAVVAAVNTARSLLKAAGYTGPVVTVDTFVAIIANPELCLCSDYAAANCHAFFDGAYDATQAGLFVSQQAKRIADVCGGMKVVITESGWPWSGATNGVAVPSKENQAAAISSIKAEFSTNIILFSACDDNWKKNDASTHDAENHWGILKQSS